MLQVAYTVNSTSTKLNRHTNLTVGPCSHKCNKLYSETEHSAHHMEVFETQHDDGPSPGITQITRLQWASACSE